jgi:hypothetical protein
MRSMRRGLLALLALAVVAAGALAVYASAARPDLDEHRDAAHERWEALRPGLDERYARLGALNDQVRNAAGPDRDVVRDLDVALATWSDAREDGGDVAREVRSANELEGLTRRLAITIEDSASLSASEGVRAAADQLSSAPVPAGVPEYEAAVAAYEAQRRGTLRALVAGVFGYEMLPSLDLATA